MPLFTFKLDSFEITQTRSAHTDTDYVCLTVQTSTFPNNVHTITSPNLGNLNNGTFNVNVRLEGLTIYPDSPVIFNYLIFNSGTFTELAVANTLQAIGKELISDPNLTNNNSALIYVEGKYAQQLSLLTKAGSCDGLVAAEQNSFTYEQMIQLIAPTYSYGRPTVHNGGYNPKGCNSKPSQYITNWSMSEVVDVSSIVKQYENLNAAETALRAAQLKPVVNGPIGQKAIVDSVQPPYPVVLSQVSLTTSLGA
jgi:hypothetical protein